MQAIATSDGLVVESYIYRPDGSFLIFGLDTTAPELVLARVRPADETAARAQQTLELVFSEQVQSAGGTLEVRDGGGEAVPAERAPTADARRWTMVFEEPLVEGAAYTFFLEAFEDLAGNAMAEAVEIEFTAPAEDSGLIVASLAEPWILAVIDGPDGLALIAGVPVDPDSVEGSSLTVVRSGNGVAGTLSLVDAASNPAWDGRVLLWTPEDPGAYVDARYDIALNLNLVDVAGNPMRGPQDTFDFDRHGDGDIVWSKASEVPLLGNSQVGNDRFLHGRPYLGSLGLYDHRARFYEPGTQLFLEPDPLGPVDSPNLYQAFGFDGLNVVDPYGLESLGEMVHGYSEEAWAPGARWWQKGLAMVAEAAYATAEMASVGAISRIDESQEAMERGEIDVWEYSAQVSGTVGRSAAVMATGGVAGQGAARLAQAAGLGIKTTATVAGAVGGMAGKLGEDVVDVKLLETRKEYSSWQEYGAAGVFGAAFGLAEGLKLEPNGTYRDSRGRLRDSNTNQFVDDPLTVKKPLTAVDRNIHNNRLDTPTPAEGYSLKNRDSRAVLKFGETTRGQKRYSRRFLRKHNAEMVFEVQGTKREMHYWQHEKILEFKANHAGKRPPLNFSDW